MRGPSHAYNTEVKNEILNFLAQNVKHDYMQGSRDINLDLTLEEASKLYEAGD